MRLSKKQLLSISLASVGVIVIAVFGYIYRAKFFADTVNGNTLISVKVVDSKDNSTGVSGAEVGVIYGDPNNADVKTNFLNPFTTAAPDAPKETFTTGAEPTPSDHNKLQDLFDTSNGQNDWGRNWLYHHINVTGCSNKWSTPCFTDSIGYSVLDLANDGGTDGTGVATFYASQFLSAQQLAANWVPLRVYVHYQGKTTAQNLINNGQFSGSRSVSVSIPVESDMTKLQADPGLTVKVEDLNGTVISGAAVSVNQLCTESNALNSGTFAGKTDQDGLYKMTAGDWTNVQNYLTTKCNTNVNGTGHETDFLVTATYGQNMVATGRIYGITGTGSFGTIIYLNSQGKYTPPDNSFTFNISQGSLPLTGSLTVNFYAKADYERKQGTDEGQWQWGAPESNVTKTATKIPVTANIAGGVATISRADLVTALTKAKQAISWGDNGTWELKDTSKIDFDHLAISDIEVTENGQTAYQQVGTTSQSTTGGWYKDISLSVLSINTVSTFSINGAGYTDNITVPNTTISAAPNSIVITAKDSKGAVLPDNTDVSGTFFARANYQYGTNQIWSWSTKGVDQPSDAIPFSGKVSGGQGQVTLSDAYLINQVETSCKGKHFVYSGNTYAFVSNGSDVDLGQTVDYSGIYIGSAVVTGGDNIPGDTNKTLSNSLSNGQTAEVIGYINQPLMLSGSTKPSIAAAQNPYVTPPDNGGGY